MPTITFIQPDGTADVVDVENGNSLMEVALNNGIPAIDGDCGGAAACGTCHIYVHDHWLKQTGAAKTEHELDMLEFAEGVAPNSRLACQITVSDALDGLVVMLLDSQH